VVEVQQVDGGQGREKVIRSGESDCQEYLQEVDKAGVLISLTTGFLSRIFSFDRNAAYIYKMFSPCNYL
jgi:hypothetical protein